MKSWHALTREQLLTGIRKQTQREKTQNKYQSNKPPEK